ncbi:MAG: VWA domain-containing protein [Acidobacteriota bacterium]|nr:VWA domain-containing protein [Acidobacteriota bacterium]
MNSDSGSRSLSDVVNHALAAIACLFLFVLPSMGQQAGTPGKNSAPPSSVTATLKELATIHVQSNLVEAPVTVTDSSGNYVQTLGVSDFEILDNGVPQHITRFGLAMQPVALVILVQTNQAVAPLLGEVRPLGSVFYGLLSGAKGQTAVLCFDNKVRMAQNFSSDPDTLSHTLQRLTTEGSGVRLNDGLARAILMLSERPASERRVIVVISEGFDRGSETNQAEIVHAATGAGVAIYGLRFEPLSVLLNNKQEQKPPDPADVNMARPGIPGQPHTPDSTQAYWNTPIDGLPLISDAINVVRSVRFRDLVDVYSKYTGGIAYGPWTKSSLQDRLQRISLDINSQYMLAYVPSDLNEQGFHRLQITVREPRLKVRARAGYFYKLKANK